MAPGNVSVIHVAWTSSDGRRHGLLNPGALIDAAGVQIEWPVVCLGEHRWRINGWTGTYFTVELLGPPLTVRIESVDHASAVMDQAMKTVADATLQAIQRTAP